MAVRIKPGQLPNGPPGGGGKRGSKRSGGGASTSTAAATLTAAAGSSSVPAPADSGDVGAEAAAAAAAGEEAAGAVASGLVRGTPARCYAPGAIVGTFLPELYLTGGDCILVGTTLMGRSKFEKVSCRSCTGTVSGCSLSLIHCGRVPAEAQGICNRKTST